jgi:Zn-dependent protease with chaperone function
LLGVLLLAFPGRHRTPPRRLPLDEWVPLVTASMVSGALAIATGLAFIALPTVTHAVGAPELLDSCHEVLAPFADDPTALGWAAFIAFLALVSRAATGAVRSYRGARAARVESWLGTHTHHDGFDLVLLPTPELLAFGVPSHPPQVVISAGVTAKIEPGGLDALIHHEAAHHRLHHSRYLTALAGIEHAFGPLVLPALRRSTGVIRDALEAWADDHAARADLDTLPLRHALIAASRESTRTVADRIDRLDRPARTRPAAARALAYTPTSALSLASVVLVIGWATDAHLFVTSGFHCA